MRSLNFGSNNSPFKTLYGFVEHENGIVKITVNYGDKQYDRDYKLTKEQSWLKGRS